MKFVTLISCLSLSLQLFAAAPKIHCVELQGTSEEVAKKMNKILEKYVNGEKITHMTEKHVLDKSYFREYTSICLTVEG